MRTAGKSGSGEPRSPRIVRHASIAAPVAASASTTAEIAAHAGRWARSWRTAPHCDCTDSTRATRMPTTMTTLAARMIRRRAGRGKSAATGPDDEVAYEGEHGDLEADDDEQQARGCDVPVVAEEVDDQLHEAQAHDPER